MDSFNYLGVIFQSNGKFKAATSRLNDKAQKAAFKMYRMLWNSNECYSISLASKLFDSLVKPIMLYGSEIWGGFSVNRVKATMTNDELTSKLFNDNFTTEKLHIKFCKRVLGVHRKASNDACRGELGRYPLMVDVCTNVLKFYQRLLCKKTNNSIIEAAFSYSMGSNSDPLV